MSFRVKAKCVKENWSNGVHTIHSWSPIGDTRELRLSNYLTFSTKGENAYITVNKEYDLELEEISYDAKWGGTYRIISCPTMDELDVENLTREESLEILMDCTSSPRLANNILDAYPNYIEIILKEGKEAIDTSKINGVGESYNSAYARDILAKFKYYKCLQEFKDYKFNTSDCKAMYEEFGTFEGVVKAMQEKPYYCLCRVLKRSFDYSDRLLMEFRPELEETVQRCEFAILDVLLRNEMDGSTRLDFDIMEDVIADEYNLPKSLLDKLTEICNNSVCMHLDEKNNSLGIMDTYVAECQIANFIKSKLEKNSNLDLDWKQYQTMRGVTLTDQQLDSLRNLCESEISLLVGFSGSGKSQSVNGIVKLCEDNGLTYTLLAPTGRASLRMTEVTHRKASTIHRKALKDAEINTDVLIVDECSMIDLPTFIMMLNVITNEDIRVVLVGDNAQLMPVGIASVFNDIINSKSVPISMLTKVFRYTSNGAQFVATNVRQGIDFFDSDEKDENGRAMVRWNGNECKVSSNYTFIQTGDIFDKLVSIYMELIDKGVKPNNILCLSPFNVGSEGTYAINSAIQSEINPPKPNETILTRDMKSTNIVFRLGDRLLNKKNDYGAIPYDVWEEIANDPTGLLTTDDFKLTSVFNGQDGVIREIDDKKVVAQFDEELIVFDKFKLVNLLLGYCISVHSSQGSEADYVINVVSPNHKRMLNRNLLYVADTRAKKKHWDIGDVSTYKSALLIDGNTLRNTWLLDLLTKC